MDGLVRAWSALSKSMVWSLKSYLGEDVNCLEDGCAEGWMAGCENLAEPNCSKKLSKLSNWGLAWVWTTKQRIENTAYMVKALRLLLFVTMRLLLLVTLRLLLLIALLFLLLLTLRLLLYYWCDSIDHDIVLLDRLTFKAEQVLWPPDKQECNIYSSLTKHNIIYSRKLCRNNVLIINTVVRMQQMLQTDLKCSSVTLSKH